MPDLGGNKGLGAVAAVGISSVLITTWMGTQVMAARKKYNVKFPAMYADKENPDANIFNCTQRGHQNTLEWYPHYIILQTLSALEYPTASALLGTVYWLGRVAYFQGYATGDPEKRLQGSCAKVGMIGMLGLAIKGCFMMACCKKQ